MVKTINSKKYSIKVHKDGCTIFERTFNQQGAETTDAQEFPVHTTSTVAEAKLWVEDHES